MNVPLNSDRMLTICNCVLCITVYSLSVWRFCTCASVFVAETFNWATDLFHGSLSPDLQTSKFSVMSWQFSLVSGNSWPWFQFIIEGKLWEKIPSLQSVAVKQLEQQHCPTINAAIMMSFICDQHSETSAMRKAWFMLMFSVKCNDS